MSIFFVVVVEPNAFVANVLRTHLRQLGCEARICDAPSFPSALAGASMVAVNVEAMTRDHEGRDRPLWHTLTQGPQLAVPTICYSGGPHAAVDTPLFTAPPGTMHVGSPQDFLALAEVIHEHCLLFARHSGLSDALADRGLPALDGTFAEFSFDAVLKLIELGGHNGVLLIRVGPHTGLIAVEKGEVVHAMVGSLTGIDAFCELFRWNTARFTFLRGMFLGIRSITQEIGPLLIEAMSSDDEAHDLLTTITPQSYVRCVRGFTDQLPGMSLKPMERRLLALVEHHPIVNDLISSVGMGSVMALKSLRNLIHLRLIEVVGVHQPTPPRR